MPPQIIGIWHHKTKAGYQTIWLTKGIERQLPPETEKTSFKNQEKLASLMATAEAKERLEERRRQRRQNAEQVLRSELRSPVGRISWDELLERCEIKKRRS